MIYIDLVYDKCIKETENAVLLDFGDKEKWVPKSVIKDGFDIEYSKENTVDVTEWFAVKKELI